MKRYVLALNGGSKVGKSTIAKGLGQRAEGSVGVVEYHVPIINIANVWGEWYAPDASYQDLMHGLSQAIKDVLRVNVDADDLLDALDANEKIGNSLRRYERIGLSPSGAGPSPDLRDLHRPILEVVGSLTAGLAQSALDDYVRQMVEKSIRDNIVTCVCTRYPANVAMVRSFPGAIVVNVVRPDLAKTHNPTETFVDEVKPDVVLRNERGVAELDQLTHALWGLMNSGVELSSRFKDPIVLRPKRPDDPDDDTSTGQPKAK